MTAPARPMNPSGSTNLPSWNSGAANQVEPSAGKKVLGWVAGEDPSSSTDNWVKARNSEMCQFLHHRHARCDTGLFGTWLQSGLLPATGGGTLTSVLAPYGDLYIDGVLVEVEPDTRNWTASKDTYIAVNEDGAREYNEVPNSDPAPTPTAGYTNIVKVVTNGLELTTASAVVPQVPTLGPSIGFTNLSVQGSGTGTPALQVQPDTNQAGISCGATGSGIAIAATTVGTGYALRAMANGGSGGTGNAAYVETQDTNAHTLYVNRNAGASSGPGTGSGWPIYVQNQGGSAGAMYVADNASAAAPAVDIPGNSNRGALRLRPSVEPALALDGEMRRQQGAAGVWGWLGVFDTVAGWLRLWGTPGGYLRTYAKDDTEQTMGSTTATTALSADINAANAAPAAGRYEVSFYAEVTDYAASGDEIEVVLDINGTPVCYSYVPTNEVGENYRSVSGWTYVDLADGAACTARIRWNNPDATETIKIRRCRIKFDGVHPT